MAYSDYKCFQFKFDSGVSFVSINHPTINLLDEALSRELDRLGRELEADASVRVVVLQSALPDFFTAHSGLGRVGCASKMVSTTRSFRYTQTIGERFRNMPEVKIAKIEGRARGGGSEIALAMDMCFAALVASFPAHAIAHAKTAVDTGAFGSMTEGLLVEGPESDLSVANDVTQARVKEALRVGAETHEGELEMGFLPRLSPTR
jgi:1,4-dihydroxy-2-naphthoyl-CoA synthase